MCKNPATAHASAWNVCAQACFGAVHAAASWLPDPAHRAQLQRLDRPLAATADALSHAAARTEPWVLLRGLARKAQRRGDFSARLGLVIAGPIAAAVAGAVRWRESVLAESLIFTLMCGHVDTRGSDLTAWQHICPGAADQRLAPAESTLILSSAGNPRSTPAALDAWQTPHQHPRWARHDFPRDDGA